MDNAVLVFMEGKRAAHRFCTEAEGRQVLSKVAEEGGSASLLITEGADVELIYLVSRELRDKVAAAKTNLMASHRVNVALDQEKVPLDLDLRRAIHRAFGNLLARPAV